MLCCPSSVTRPSSVLSRLAVGLAITNIWACLGCHEVTGPGPTGKNKSPLVIELPADAETIVIAPVPWPATVRMQGSLAADERSVISAKVPGRVAETVVDLGDVVTTGQVLARLEIRDFELGVRQAEAQLAEACASIGIRADESAEDLDPELVPAVAVERALRDDAIEAFERLKQLRKSNSVSESEYRKQRAMTRVTEARYEAARRKVDENKSLIELRRVQLDVAKQNLEDATIRAPFDGVIQQRHLAAGAFVQAGTPLFTQVRVDPLRFRGRIPERKATEVQQGQQVAIIVEGAAEPIQATINRVSPSLDLASRSLEVESLISNAAGLFRSGLYAEGLIEVDPNATTIAIPRQALGEFAGVNKCWCVVDGQLTSRKVTLGRVGEASMIEITEGLALDDVVLADFEAGEIARRNAGQQGSQAQTEASH